MKLQLFVGHLGELDRKNLLLLLGEKLIPKSVRMFVAAVLCSDARHLLKEVDGYELCTYMQATCARVLQEVAGNEEPADCLEMWLVRVVNENFHMLPDAEEYEPGQARLDLN